MFTILAFSGMSILIIIAVLLAMICVGLGAWAVISRRELPEDLIGRRLSSLDESSATTDSKSANIDLFQPSVGGSLASRLSVFSKPLEIKSDYERSKMAMRLAQAGCRQPGAVMVFLSSKMIFMVVGATLGFLFAYYRGMSGLNIFNLTTVFAILGFMGPNFWLSSVSSKRTENIGNALPDSLDMLVIAVEAGLGLDAAIQRVGEEMKRTFPDLAQEWQMAARETQMGIPREEAMAKMAERSNVPDMRSLVAILTQAEKFGTSIAQTLRVHAETVRIKRRQRAEERAAKTTVKLLFPLVFFLFPVIFIVLLGPLMVKFMKSGFLN